MYLMLVFRGGGCIYTSLSLLAVVAIFRLLSVTPHGQSFELWWLPTVCTIISNGLFNFVSIVSTSSEGPGSFVCQCYLVGLEEIVQVSWFHQSHQHVLVTAPFSVVIYIYIYIYRLSLNSINSGKFVNDAISY